MVALLLLLILIAITVPGASLFIGYAVLAVIALTVIRVIIWQVSEGIDEGRQRRQAAATERKQKEAAKREAWFKKLAEKNAELAGKRDDKLAARTKDNNEGS
jgi:hypothetical protein